MLQACHNMDALTLKKYEALPNDLQKEVMDFIDFLGSKYVHATQQPSLAQKRSTLYGNAKGEIKIMPGFDDIPEGFETYQ